MKIASDAPTGVEPLFAFQTQRVRWFSRYVRVFRLFEVCATTCDESASAEVTNVFPYEHITKLAPVTGTAGDFVIELLTPAPAPPSSAATSAEALRQSSDSMDATPAPLPTPASLSSTISESLSATFGAVASQTKAPSSKSYVYESPSRTRLLCHFFECILGAAPASRLVAGRTEFPSALRVKRSGLRAECHLTVCPFGLVESDPYSSPSGRAVRVYYYYNMQRFGKTVPDHIYFEYEGRIKIFQLNSSGVSVHLVSEIKASIVGLGMACEDVFADEAAAGAPTTLQEIVSRRNAAIAAASHAGSVSTFEVNKITRRYLRPIPRQIHINEESIVEKDGSGFVVTGYRKINSIFLIVRSAACIRELSIEFDDGATSTYTSASRDTLIALLLDISYAIGNFRVAVAGAPSSGVRLIPRSVTTEAMSSSGSFLTGTVFSQVDSVEARLVRRLVLMNTSASRAARSDRQDVMDVCTTFNANIPYPGIAPSTDSHTVKACLGILLRCLNAEILDTPLCLASPGQPNQPGHAPDNSPSPIVTLLQTLHKIIPCVHGYKSLVEVEEIDARLVLRQLLRLGDQYTGYWCLQVLLVLCKCPLMPRNAQQEFVNKQVLLTDDMITAVMDLISAPATSAQEEKAEGGGGAGGAGGQSEDDPSTKFERAQAFLPNPLVAMAAAAILESIVSSKKDTTSPELANKVMDMLSQRSEVLVHMMRSVSFLIMEHAAILMFVLLKHRPEAGQALKEMALSEGLALKHFYNSVYSPSSTQRFLSRFLAATWLCGKEEHDPGKALLRRIIPTGLVDFLKHSPLSEAHRANLDDIEEAFYAGLYGAQSVSRCKDIQLRMSYRVSALLKERSAPKQHMPLLDAGEAENPARGRGASFSAGASLTLTLTGASAEAPICPSASSAIACSRVRSRSSSGLLSKSSAQWAQPARPAAFDNYRIMFFMMTQNHNMPDLIWNEQTRLELRSLLELEIKNFEQEQRLRGSHEVAWNFQQFTVTYSSLQVP